MCAWAAAVPLSQGGIRNFLAVRGPGIPQGGTSGQLAGLVDVLPMLAELAGLGQLGHATPDA